MPMKKRGNVTLDTNWQEIHDGSSFCFIQCSAIVQCADSGSPAAGDVTQAPADKPYLLPMGKATFAKVASSTATCYLNR